MTTTKTTATTKKSAPSKFHEEKYFFNKINKTILILTISLKKKQKQKQKKTILTLQKEKIIAEL